MTTDIHRCCFTLTKYIPDFLNWKIENICECLIDIYNEDVDLAMLPHIVNDILQVSVLRNLPLIPQRSQAWFDLRMNRLTASDLAQSIGKGKFGTKKALLEKKAFPETAVFNSFMAPLKWGIMFEEMGMRSYQQSVNTAKLYEFGLIPNKDIVCFGASPDGITETGIMVEMKCPYKRKCTNEVPEQYYLQIQGQLATCHLTYCDYVECYFEAFNDMCEYNMVCKDMTTKDHGIIIEFMNENENYVYEYSPEWLTAKQCASWANTEVAVFMKANPSHTFVKMTPFRLKQLYHTRVEFNRELWASLVPQIYAFWAEVEDLRVKGLPEKEVAIKKPRAVKTTLNMADAVKYKFIEDSDEERS